MEENREQAFHGPTQDTGPDPREVVMVFRPGQTPAVEQTGQEADVRAGGNAGQASDPREVVLVFQPGRPLARELAGTEPGARNTQRRPEPEEVVLTYQPGRPLSVKRPGAPSAPAGRQAPSTDPYRWSAPSQEVVEAYAQARTTLPGAHPPAAPLRRRRRRGLCIFLAVLAAVAVLTAGSVWLNQSAADRPEPGGGEDWAQLEDRMDDEVTIDSYPTGLGARLELAQERGSALTAQQVYAQVNPAVVTVIVQLDQGASLGTGVLFTSDGYLLTNYHVVAGGRDCSVGLASGATYDAKFVGGDQANDIAVLKVDAKGLPAAVMGDSDSLVVGDTVYAIGNPLGVELRGTLTDGIVSAINRNVRVDDRTMTLIQTNAALNQGNSGGPLINIYGQVVGINTIKMMSVSMFSNVEGLGFALPMSSVQGMVNDILAYGEVRPEPVIGVTVNSAPVRLPDGRKGAEVVSVDPGSAAAGAGVLPGDVIVSAGEKDVTSSADLLRIRRTYNVGDKMPMTVWREDGYVDLTLQF